VGRDAVGTGEEHEVGGEHRGGGVALVVEELLPLPDHPEVSVVDDGDLDVELLLLQGGQLARRHLEPAVTRHHPHLGVGARHLGPDGRGEREAHRPQAAGGDEGPRALVRVVLRLPHLVLAHVSHHDRLSAGGLPQVVDHVGGVEPAPVGLMEDVAAAGLAAPAADLVQPGIMPARGHQGKKGQDRRPEVGDQRHVDRDVLAHLGRVDLDVDLLRELRVGREVAGHPVVEPHAEGEDQIGALDGLVDVGLAVHAHHPEAQRVAGGEPAEAEEREGDGGAGLLGEGPERLGRAGFEHAVAGEDEGPLRGRDQIHRAGQGPGIRRGRFLEPRQVHGFRPHELGLGLLRVLADVHEHRSGPPRLRDDERLADRRRDVARFGDERVVLGDGERDAGDVGLLERVGAEELRGDLAGDEHRGDRVHHRGGDAGREVRRPRARRRDRDADLAARPRVAVGHVGRPLLVPDEDVPDRVIQHGVVGGQDRASGIPEDRLDAFPQQAFPDDLGASEHLSHRVSPPKTKTPGSFFPGAFGSCLASARSQLPRAV
jgi:hypothetical protein